MPSTSGVSAAFHQFLAGAPRHAEAWMTAVRGLDAASALDPKTKALAYLAVLAALRLESGIPLHVREAVKAGATAEEVVSAVLVGLPAAGNAVTHAVGPALAALESTG